MYVAIISSDVAKVDLDIAYVFVMAFKCFFWCFRCVLQVFQLFRMYVASVFI